MQGDAWDAYGGLDTFSAERNAGSPTGRAPYGDGVLVGVDGVTPVQGARENRVQGEGGQVTRPTPQGRHARCGAPKPFWASLVTGKLLEIERLTSSLEGGRWKRAARHLAGGLPYLTYGSKRGLRHEVASVIVVLDTTS
jgi:hypothetical protein